MCVFFSVNPKRYICRNYQSPLVPPLSFAFITIIQSFVAICVHKDIAMGDRARSANGFFAPVHIERAQSDTNME